MKGNDYDERYPAMFQPGGEHLVFEPGPPEINPETAAAPAPADDRETPPEQGAGGNWGTFNPRPFMWALGAALLVLLAGIGCLTVGFFLPSALAFTRDPLQGIPATPWGVTLAVLAAPLVTASLAAIAVILLLASRQHLAPVAVLRKCTISLGLASLALATVLLFNERLFPTAGLWNPESSSYPPAQVWNVFVGTGALPITTLGLAIVLGAVVNQPHKDRGIVAGKTVRAGGLLFIGSFIMNFATQLFPTATGTQIELDGGGMAQTSPWTYLIAPAANAGTFVGATALLLGIVLMTMPRHGPRQDAAGAKETATGI